MHRCVGYLFKKFILLIALTIFFNVANAKIVLEPIIVTAKIPQPASQLNREVYIIEKEEIEDLPIESLADLLEYVGSIDVRQRGSYGIQADFSIRGSSFEQVLILINGLRVNDPQTGHHNSDIPLTLDDIEKVEVMPGPGSAIYGHGAFGGVINIITKEAKRKVKACLTKGGHDLNQETISLGEEIKGLSLGLTWERRISDGYRENTDFDDKNVSFHLERNKFKFLFGFNDKRFGANSFYTTAYPNQWERTQTTFFSAINEFNLKEITIKPALFFRRHNDHFTLDRNAPLTYMNTHKTYVYGGELPLSFSFSFIEIVAGLELNREEIKSSALGNHFRWHEGIFLSFYPRFDRLTMSLDLRGDGYSEKWGWEFSPAFNMAYQLKEWLKLRGGFGRSFRIPSYTELYYFSPVNRGNPDLFPEYAWSIEGGLDILKTNWQAGLTVFYRWGEDIIDWVKKEDFWEAQNISRINTLGTTLLFKTKLKGHLFCLDYTYLNQNDREVAKYLNYLRHKLDLRIIFKLPYNITQGLCISYQKRINQDSYTILNARFKRAVKWKGNRFSIFIETSNLFNTSYYDNIGVPMPGRWILGGLEVELF